MNEQKTDIQQCCRILALFSKWLLVWFYISILPFVSYYLILLWSNF